MNEPDTNPNPSVPDTSTTASGAASATQQRRRDRFVADLERVLRSAWDMGAHVVRQGNRRRVTLRSRAGEVWVRMPLTLAVLVTALLLPAWPLLVVLTAVGFAVGAQLSVERLADDPAAAASQAPNGAA